MVFVATEITIKTRSFFPPPPPPPHPPVDALLPCSSVAFTFLCACVSVFYSPVRLHPTPTAKTEFHLILLNANHLQRPLEKLSVIKCRWMMLHKYLKYSISMNTAPSSIHHSFATATKKLQQSIQIYIFKLFCYRFLLLFEFYNHNSFATWLLPNGRASERARPTKFMILWLKRIMVWVNATEFNPFFGIVLSLLLTSWCFICILDWIHSNGKSFVAIKGLHCFVISFIIFNNCRN